MASRLNPYLSFNGDARAALAFYQQVFGGTLKVNTFAEFGGPPGPDADRIMHGQLETDSGYTLMGADIMSTMDFSPGNTITVSLSGEDGDELRGYFEKLSDGGTVQTPLEKQVWGDEFGMLVDRYGTPWMVNITQG
jgi:PhnB protein